MSHYGCSMKGTLLNFLERSDLLCLGFDDKSVQNPKRQALCDLFWW